jgi:uncharacterized membrane protein YphA (DoxX/SURF4 family)
MAWFGSLSSPVLPPAWLSNSKARSCQGGLSILLGCVLPFLEALIGLALILGVFTRWTLAGASLLMSILIFGTSLRSDWTIVGLQMIYAIAFFIALFLLEHNHYSVDRISLGEEL